MGIKSYIVMPRTAPEIKKRGVKGYGGEIFECEPTLASRESTLSEVIGKTGAVEIHPFNNYEVMAGQATAARELFEDVPDLNFIVVPVGGGGLLSGTALATRFFSPETVVVVARTRTGKRYVPFVAERKDRARVYPQQHRRRPPDIARKQNISNHSRERQAGDHSIGSGNYSRYAAAVGTP